MRRNKTTVIIVMCIAIVFMAVGYALLSTRLDISGSTAVTSTWKVEFSAIRTINTRGGATNKITPTASGTTANFEVDLIFPGDEITYEIDITNYGDIDAEVRSATYSITGSEVIYVYIDGIKKGTLIGGCEGLDTCPKVTLILKIGYKSDVTKDPTEKTKDIEITINVGQYVEGNPTEEVDLIPELKEPEKTKNYLSTQILADNNGGQSDENINFGQISSDTNGKGLYYTNTNTEDGKTTYYFRGAVENNFVQFGQDTSGNDLYWRIIRINEDGSIRMILEDHIGSSIYSSSYVDTILSSTAETGVLLDNWYNTYLTSYSALLSDAGYCLYSSTTDNGAGQNYDNGSRLESSSPTLQYGCTTRLTQSSGGFSGPIGLITADEVIYAGGLHNTTNTSFYLYKDYSYWTITPRSYEMGVTTIYVVDNGKLSFGFGSHDNVNGGEYIRPAINLKATVEISDEIPSGCAKQNGTASCPYIIKTN